MDIRHGPEQILTDVSSYNSNSNLSDSASISGSTLTTNFDKSATATIVSYAPTMTTTPTVKPPIVKPPTMMTTPTATTTIKKKMDKILDIAVICEEFSPLQVACDDDNVTVLDDIHISLSVFKKLFYPFGENFGINKDVVNNQKALMDYISFQSALRTVNTRPFDLLEVIMSNIESDLNVSRNAFTTSSRVELVNEFLRLKSLCDLNCCSVAASLPWSSVEEIMSNFQKSNPDYTVQPVFIISIQFKTPTPGVKPTTVKFVYKISDEA